MNVKIIEVANISDLTKLLMEDIDKSTAFITGFSGAGKNWLASKLLKTKKNWLFLDELGSEEGGKWVIDVKSTPSYLTRRFIVGSSDNFKTVVKAVMDVAKPSIVKVVIPIPEPTLFRAICAAKAADYRGEHASWRDYWLSLSKLSDSAVKKHIRLKIDRTLKDFANLPDDVELKVYSFPHAAEGAVGRGWHELKLSEDAKSLDFDYPHLSKPKPGERDVKADKADSANETKSTS